MTVGVNGLNYPNEKILSVQGGWIKSQDPIARSQEPYLPDKGLDRGRTWKTMFLVNRIWKQTGVVFGKAN